MDRLVENVRQFRRLDEATLSRNVPPIPDHDPIPTAVFDDRRQSSFEDFRFKRGLLPQRNAAEWEVPVLTGGADWERNPRWTTYDMPGPSDGYMAFDPMRPNDPGSMTSRDGKWVKESTALAGMIRAMRDSDQPRSAVSEDDDAPLGLVSKEAPSIASRASSWLKSFSLSGVGSAVKTPPTPSFLAKRKKKKTEPEDPNEKKTFSTRHKPGSAAHIAQMVLQARELRRLMKRPYFIVDYGGKKYVTSKPAATGKIVFKAEQVRALMRKLMQEILGPGAGMTMAGGAAPAHATTSANVGARTTSGLPFFGRRGLATLEKERKTRMKKAKKNPGSEWDAPVQTGGVALLSRRPMGSTK